MQKLMLICLIALAIGLAQAEVADIPSPAVDEQTLVVNAAKTAVATSQQLPISMRCNIAGWRFLDNACTLEMFYEFVPFTGSIPASGTNPQTMTFYRVSTENGRQWIYKTNKWMVLNTSGQLPTGLQGKN